MDKKLKQLELELTKSEKKKEKLEVQNYKLSKELQNSETQLETLVR